MAKILVLYHSQQFGNTHAMAEAVAEGAKSAGAEVLMLNTNDERLDIETYRSVDAAAFGSPDYYHYIAGGLGSAVAELCSQEHPVPIKMIGIGDYYAGSGPYEELLGLYGLQSHQIAESIKDFVSAF